MNMPAAPHIFFSNHWKNGVRIFQSLELFALLLGAAWADEPSPVFGTNEQAHLQTALACLNMTERDAGFEKDLGKPVVVLPWIRRLLDDPLSLPGVADRVFGLASSREPDGLWSAAFDWLGVKRPDDKAAAKTRTLFKGLDPELADALGLFVQAAGQADALLDKAFDQVTEKDRRYAVASYFASTFNATAPTLMPARRAHASPNSPGRGFRLSTCVTSPQAPFKNTTPISLPSPPRTVSRR